MAIKFEGLESVLKAFEEMGNIANVEESLNKATLHLEGEVKMKAPKGEIRNSISSEVDGLTGKVFTPLEYAPYVEYGTGLFAEGEGGGRQEVPWVYVKGNTSSSTTKTIHTEESANQAVAFLRSKGLEAYKTSGQKPQPFMRPAMDENKDRILEILKEGLIGND